MEMFDMDTVEEIFCGIRPQVCIFLCDHLLRYRHGLKYVSLLILAHVFILVSGSLVADQVY